MSWDMYSPFVQDSVATGVAVAVLIVLVLLLRKPFAMRFGARAAYALWALPVIRLILPPLPANLSLAGWMGFGPQPDTPSFATINVSGRQDVFVHEQFFGGQTVGVLPTTPTVSVVEPTSASLFEATGGQLTLVLIGVWALGALAWLGLSIYRSLEFRQLIDCDSDPAPDRLQADVRGIARQIGLKNPPEVRVSFLCSGPLVTGLFRPVVLLPKWFELDYSKPEQRDALVHELTHLKRKDLWAFQLARVVAATQWFNPLTYIALKAFRTDQEAACDADVLRLGIVSPAQYGQTLVKAARLGRGSDHRLAAASLTLSHPIKERLIMMQNPEPSLRQRVTGTALAGVVGTAALFATASCMAAQAAGGDDANTVIELSTGPSDETGPQTILLGDPFADTIPPMLEELDALDGKSFAFEFDFDFEHEIGEDMAELEALMGELEGQRGSFAKVFKFDMTDGDGENIFVMRPGESEEEFEARIEEWADRIEIHSEVFERQAKALERQAEVIALRIETKAEAYAEAHEAKAAKLHEALGPDFEAKIEASARLVEALHAKCDARASDDPSPEIVTSTDDETGKKLSAVCVNGDRAVVVSSGLADWVSGRNDLTDEEKAAFLEHRGRRHVFAFSNGPVDIETVGPGTSIIIEREYREEAEAELGGEEE